MPGRMVAVNLSGPDQGVNCCCGCVRCCGCINWSYVTSSAGIAKIVEFIVGSMCQSLAIKFGLSHAADMGSAFDAYLSACSAALLGSGCLLLCFLLSEKSVKAVRSSLFETLYNGMCAFLVLSSSSSLLAAVNFFLWPRYLITPFYIVYPAMFGASCLGLLLGGVYVLDCYMSYRHYKGYTPGRRHNAPIFSI
ncbi:protein singles bar [Neocloeon triangulifer]|uniref:protein singles bar n=1 Tax=Neocloeon triangulifer TaxID=2078957 RepID=UPI00286F69A7|nr:protein singles bar [Neocloeon triangulifer]